MRKMKLLLVLYGIVVAACAQSLSVLPGERIAFDGDSITRGFAFGNYTDPSPLRTLYGMASILLKENLRYPPATIWLPGVWEGLNPDGSAKTVDTLAGEIQTYLRRGELRTGDWLIYEDAGEIDKAVHPAPWPSDRNMYRRYREGIRNMILEADDSVGRDHILLMTMFDYDPKYPHCQWDAPLDDGIHTGNDAIRDEAAALGIRVIDMNRIMDRAEDYVHSLGWGRLVGPDGIHPNVYGNYVMTIAILGALGADVANWRIDALFPHFRHPSANGDVETVWGFGKDPSDQDRVDLLKELQHKVTSDLQAAILNPPPSNRNQQCSPPRSFQRIIRYGRLLDHPAVQPEGTSKPVSYEVGKLFQLDRESVLLVASMREQGGHDFEVGNDGFVFHDLSEIVPENAIPINRVDPKYPLKSGGFGVLSKFPVNGGIIPIGTKLPPGVPTTIAGTGFFLSATTAYAADRSDRVPNNEDFVEFMQVAWNGHSLKVSRDELPQPLASHLRNIGFDCLLEGDHFLCPLVTDEGTIVARFDYTGGRWKATDTGKPFVTVKPEVEESLHKVDDSYLVYTRGVHDARGRVYRSQDGLNYHLSFDHWNHTVPQGMNQGLDGSLYLATNTGPGWLRNPLLAFSLVGHNFVNPVIVHDEKQIGDDRGRTKGQEVPFCDHGIGNNVFLKGQWHHFLLYRVCDLSETNGNGAPPFPQTGLYMVEMVYNSATALPFHF
jgi:hypothetical protein